MIISFGLRFYTSLPLASLGTAWYKISGLIPAQKININLYIWIYLGSSLLGFIASAILAIPIPHRTFIVTAITTIVSTLRGIQSFVTKSICRPCRIARMVTTITTIIATFRIIQFMVTLAIVIQLVMILMLATMTWVQASTCSIFILRIPAPFIPIGIGIATSGLARFIPTRIGIVTTITPIISTFWVIQICIAQPIFVCPGILFPIWTLDCCFTSRWRF